MFRTIENDLTTWKDDPYRKPLLIRGARQVGKSYTVEQFGKKYFEQTLIINFELEPQLISCFESLEPTNIIRCISLIKRQMIVAGKTLLFLDEIQQCPMAIMALRYFKEKMPTLHVIGAGSFLEFVINAEEYSQPVGRVQSLYMKPCSWFEYLHACQEQPLIDYLSTVTAQTSVEPAIHAHLMEKCREYFIVGGMPEVVAHYTETQAITEVDKNHATILEYYQRDFPKYSRKIKPGALEKIFSKAPGLVAKHFKYVDIDPNIPARDLKPALEMLVKAGIIHQVTHTTANGLPLEMGINEKKFKLLFLDIGLVKHALGLDALTLLKEELILINQGNLAEQFVGQELLAYSPSYEQHKLYYWEREKRGSQAEVDYVISIRGQIYPIEVKAGKTGRLKSIQTFLQEKKLPLGIRISQNPLMLSQNILSVPFYLIHELPRLIEFKQEH